MKQKLTKGQQSWRTRRINGFKQTLKSVLSVVIISVIFTAISPTAAQTPNRDDWGMLPIAENKKNLTNQERVIIYAQQAGLNIQEVLDVIRCESNFNPKASSNISTARGISQFIFGTWDKYCEGDVKDLDDNMKCFVKLYPKHKDWWECSRITGWVNK